MNFGVKYLFKGQSSSDKVY